MSGSYHGKQPCIDFLMTKNNYYTTSNYEESIDSETPFIDKNVSSQVSEVTYFFENYGSSSAHRSIMIFKFNTYLTKNYSHGRGDGLWH